MFSGAIIGVGTAKRINAVHWGIAQDMIKAWGMTIPLTAMMSALAFAATILFSIKQSGEIFNAALCFR